jgi:DNA topoisomerase-1
VTRSPAQEEYGAGELLPLDDPEAAAGAAGLVYVSDTDPGLARRRAGKGFTYRGPDGSTVRDRATLERVRALAIPPAWSDVWVCAAANGHLQATGWDARGRKQYRYHARWREVRDVAKFTHLAHFGRALPEIRARARADQARPGLDAAKVVAAVVELLDTTLIRVGNERYARDHDSFGLTTMRCRHAVVAGSKVEFRFRAKGGKEQRRVVSDMRLARLVRRCQELPGQVLFHYPDDQGGVHPVGSREVNDYLAGTTGGGFTAKEFRTWGASVCVLAELRAAPPASTVRERTHTINDAVRSAAAHLGNTLAVCRASYVHPAVIEAYPDGLAELSPKAVRRVAAVHRGLDDDEAALLALIEQTGARRARRRKAG